MSRDFPQAASYACVRGLNQLFAASQEFVTVLKSDLPAPVSKKIARFAGFAAVYAASPATDAWSSLA